MSLEETIQPVASPIWKPKPHLTREFGIHSGLIQLPKQWTVQVLSSILLPYQHREANSGPHLQLNMPWHVLRLTRESRQPQNQPYILTCMGKQVSSPANCSQPEAEPLCLSSEFGQHPHLKKQTKVAATPAEVYKHRMQNWSGWGKFVSLLKCTDTSVRKQGSQKIK